MNPISAFLVHHLIFVYFLYGLAFFAMGLALLLARRRNPALPLAVALGPLTLFALLHGAHEWYEMFQLIDARITGSSPSLWGEWVRLVLLVLSFCALILFGTTPMMQVSRGWLRALPVGGLLTLWLLGGGVVYLVRQPAPAALLDMLDVLARYCLGLPGALLGAWALMRQQQLLREQNLSQFSRDLVWCASALLLYGVVGQLFVRPTALPPSTVLNSETFLAWFGVPVQLFRALLAGGCTIFLIKALRIFDVESQRRLAEANQSRLQAQSQVLAAERRSVAEISRLNDELRLSTRELSLLLELSNILVTPQALATRLTTIIEKIVENLHFTDAGLILLIDQKNGTTTNATHTGFLEPVDDGQSRYSRTLALGRRSTAEGRALCSHADGQVLEIQVEVNLLKQACAQYVSPTLYIALPIHAQQQV
ncbi:MAG: hypothetical protein KDE47_09875, partial [Caldilineaceae bacterium]|nr:hypothetical protein [Caldilineaceae bacterium]